MNVVKNDEKDKETSIKKTAVLTLTGNAGSNEKKTIVVFAVAKMNLRLAEKHASLVWIGNKREKNCSSEKYMPNTVGLFAPVVAKRLRNF